MSLVLVTVCLFTLTLPPVWSAPSIVFPDEEHDKIPPHISDNLTECLLDEFKIYFNGECRALLKPDINICPEGHWLVLDLAAASLPNPGIRGKCAVQRCQSHQHFWISKKKCVHDNESSSLCPVGNIIDTDYFGDGYCNCIKNPVHIENKKTGACYPAYKQGPCSKDKVWVKDGCQFDQCGMTRTRDPKKTFVPWFDGKCYAVNEQGPCKQGNDVLINFFTGTPECVDRLTSLNLVGAPCGTDHSGKCTRPVTPPQTIFYSQVASQVNKKRT